MPNAVQVAGSADYSQLDPSSVTQGFNNANSLMQGYARNQAGAMEANGDPTGAANEVLRSGDLTGGMALRTQNAAALKAQQDAQSAAATKNYQFIVDTANSLENVRKTLGTDKMLEAFDQLVPVFKQREGASDQSIQQMREALAANPDTFLQGIATNAQSKITDMAPGHVLMNDQGEYVGGVPAFHTLVPGAKLFESDPGNTGGNVNQVAEGNPMTPEKPPVAPTPFTLPPGGRRYGPDGKLIADNPAAPKAGQPGGKLPTQDAARLKAMDTWLDSAEQLGDYSGQFMQRAHGVNTGPQWNQFGGHSSGSGGANVGGVRPGAVYDYMFNPQEYGQIQELDAITNRVTPMLRPAGSGRILGPEYTNFGRAFPSSKNVATANAGIDQEIQQQLGSARAKVTFYHKWAEDHGNLDGADSAWIQARHAAVAGAAATGAKHRTWDPVRGLQ